MQQPRQQSKIQKSQNSGCGGEGGEQDPRLADEFDQGLPSLLKLSPFI